MPIKKEAYEKLETKGYFRVLHGHHHEGGKTYSPSDGVFASKSDLLKFNKLNAVKFEKVHDYVPKTEQSDGDGLDSFTVAELKEYAAAEEIDLTGVKTKEEILAKIRGN